MEDCFWNLYLRNWKKTSLNSYGKKQKIEIRTVREKENNLEKVKRRDNI